MGRRESPYCRWLTLAPRIVPASELCFVMKSSVWMCSVSFSCPFRSSLHLLPSAAYPGCCLSWALSAASLDLQLLAGGANRESRGRSEGGARERGRGISSLVLFFLPAVLLGAVFLTCPKALAMPDGWPFPFSSLSSSYQRSLPTSPSDPPGWKQLPTITNFGVLHHSWWFPYTLIPFC